MNDKIKSTEINNLMSAINMNESFGCFDIITSPIDFFCYKMNKKSRVVNKLTQNPFNYINLI